MHKYLVVPHWLIELLENNNESPETCVDFDRLSKLLTPEEMSIYSYVNTQSFSDRLQSIEGRRMLKRLAEDQKTINLFQAGVAAQNCVSNYFSSDQDLITIINGSMAKDNLDSKFIKLVPQRLARDVLCLIPRFYNNTQREFVRGDIYEALRCFMSVDEILQSPLFGL